MYVTAIIMYSVFLTTVHCFENSKKRKFISPKFQKQEKFVTSKFRKNSHHFAAFSSKYRIERCEIPREISSTCRRKFMRTIDEIRRNSLSLLLHSTVHQRQPHLDLKLYCQALRLEHECLCVYADTYSFSNCLARGW